MEDCNVCLSPVLSDGVQCETCERTVHKACVTAVESDDGQPCIICKVCFNKGARARAAGKRPDIPAILPVEGPATANAECPMVPLAAQAPDDAHHMDPKQKHLPTVNISSPAGDQTVTDSHAVMAAGAMPAPRANKVCFARCVLSVRLDCVFFAFFDSCGEFSFQRRLIFSGRAQMTRLPFCARRLHASGRLSTANTILS